MIFFDSFLSSIDLFFGLFFFSYLQFKTGFESYMRAGGFFPNSLVKSSSVCCAKAVCGYNISCYILTWFVAMRHMSTNCTSLLADSFIRMKHTSCKGFSRKME